MRDEVQVGPSEERFWMVWCRGRNAPTYRHSSGESAATEAKRLARQHPSERFYVMKCTGGYEVSAPPITSVTMTEPVPF